MYHNDIIFLVSGRFKYKLVNTEQIDLPSSGPKKRKREDSADELLPPKTKLVKREESPESNDIVIDPIVAEPKKEEVSATTLATTDDLVDNIMGILPDMSRAVVLRSLMKTAGNIEEAVNLLLTGDVTPVASQDVPSVVAPVAVAVKEPSVVAPEPSVAPKPSEPVGIPPKPSPIVPHVDEQTQRAGMEVGFGIQANQ